MSLPSLPSAGQLAKFVGMLVVSALVIRAVKPALPASVQRYVPTL